MWSELRCDTSPARCTSAARCPLHWGTPSQQRLADSTRFSGTCTMIPVRSFRTSRSTVDPDRERASERASESERERERESERE